MASADLTGDGFPEIVVATTWHDPPVLLLNRGLDPGSGQWLGLLDRSDALDLPPCTPTPTPPPVPVPQSSAFCSEGDAFLYCGVALGDVTDDGAPDIYLAGYNGTDDKLLVNRWPAAQLFEDQSSDRLESAAGRVGDNGVGDFNTQTDLIDMNGDGQRDIVINRALPLTTSGAVGIFYNTQSGAGSWGFFDVSPAANAVEVIPPNPETPPIGEDHHLSFAYMYAIDDFVEGNCPVEFDPEWPFFNIFPFDCALASNPTTEPACSFECTDLPDLFIVDDAEDGMVSRVSIRSTVTGETAIAYGYQKLGIKEPGGNAKSADIDRDGLPDVAVASEDQDEAGSPGPQGDECSDRDLESYVASSTAARDPLNVAPPGLTQNFDLEFVDLDGDGCPELFVAGCDEWKVFENTACVCDDVDADGICNVHECGDASGDGLVNSIDARLIQRASVGIIPEPALCDVTGDGVCNGIDARLVQRVSVGQVPKSQLGCAVRPETPPLSAASADGDCLADAREPRPDTDPLLADSDGDGYDDCDELLMGSDPREPDSDGDTVPDAQDNCPVASNASQADQDADGIGDACECGDQSGDGTVNLTDVFAINDAILGIVAVSALCDTNHDDACNLEDILNVSSITLGECIPSCDRRPPDEHLLPSIYCD